MRTHRLIPYSEEFLILTCPTTRTKSAKLDAARGIVVNGLRYYHPLMRFSKEAGKPVEVRYEPFDMSRAYAFVDGFNHCTEIH
jgi:putative transposase